MGGIQGHHDLFISYGRVDSKDFAIDLRNCLSAAQYQVWLDLEEIPPAVNYQQYINGAIERADNFCFIISPHAVHSPHCLIELELALQYGKRIIPIMQVETISQVTWQQRHPEGTEADWQQYVAQGLHSSQLAMPEVLQQLNWILNREGIDDSGLAFDQLVDTLNSANLYVHQHTMLLVKALDWDRHQRQTQYLLSGEDRPGAEGWLKTEFNDGPAPCRPTILHGEYITESIKNADNLDTQVLVINAGVDDALVRKLQNSLMVLGITVWLDHHDAHAGVNLKAAIKQGIEKTDNVVFLRGPQTVLKNWAAQLRYAQSLHKRIIPLCVGDQLLPLPEIPHHCHWIILEQPADANQYQNALDKLLFTLHQEIDYVTTHKRLLVQALKWERQTRHPCLLLQGHNLRRAEGWLRLAQEGTTCPATDLQTEFIQASLSAPMPDSLDVFISYSRVDGEMARRLNEALQIQGKTTWFDQESIVPGENFRQEIYQGIARCDNVLFLLSPRSIQSPYCSDEVKYAARLNKRFITALCHPVDPKALPAPLAEVQWIDFSQGSQDFFGRFSELVRTLETDREHIHQHTKWSQQAMNWLEDDQNPDLLLRGSEFAIAAQWLHRADTLAKQPAPTDHQRQFITASQQAIEAANKAEAERQAELLRLEQARTQEAEARLEEEKKSARRQRHFLEAAALALLLAVGLGSATYLQYRKATVNQITALVNSSNNYYNSNQKLEALITAIKASKILRQNPILRWRKQDLEHRTNAILQQAVSGIDEENRLVANASYDGDAMGHRDRVTGVAFSPDGETLASSSWDGTVRLWNPSGKSLDVFRSNFSPNAKATETSETSGDSATAADDAETAATKTRFTEVAFSPDGQLLAAGNEDSRIYLWDMATKEQANPPNLPIYNDRNEFLYRGHDDVPNSLAFGTQKGNLLLASGHSDEMVRLWDLTPRAAPMTTQDRDNETPPFGELLRMCQGNGEAQGGAVLDVAINPDGWLVASGGESHHLKPPPHPDHPEAPPHPKVSVKTIRLWAVAAPTVSFSDRPWATSTRPCRLVDNLPYDQGVHSVVFAQNATDEGRLLATGGHDGTINLWQLKHNQVTSYDPIETLKDHQGAVMGLTFTKDGKYLISGSWDKTIKIWRVADGALMRTLHGHTAAVMDVDVFWDAPKKRYRILSGGDDATVRLWQFKPDQVTKLAGHDGAVLSLAYSPDGQYLASGSDDRTLRVWPLEQDKLGGNALLLAEPALIKSESSALQAPDSEKLETSPLAHTDSIWSVGFSPTKPWLLASASWDGRVKLWHLPPLGSSDKPQRIQVIRDHRDRVNALTFSPNGQWLITGSWDRRVKLWRWRPLTHSSTDRFLYYRDLVTPRHNISPENEVYAVAYSRHDLIAAASGDHSIYVWNRAGQLIQKIPKAHNARIFSLAFSPTQPNLLASGGADHQVKLWSIERKGTEWRAIPAANEQLNQQQAIHAGPVHTVAFSHNGQYLASASRDTTIKVWEISPDPLRPQLKTTLTGHNDVVVALAFHPSKLQLASGSDDKSILLWDVSRLQEQHLGNLLGQGCERLADYLHHSQDALAFENRNLCSGIESGIELPATDF